MTFRNQLQNFLVFHAQTSAQKFRTSQTLQILQLAINDVNALENRTEIRIQCKEFTATDFLENRAHFSNFRVVTATSKFVPYDQQ